MSVVTGSLCDNAATLQAFWTVDVKILFRQD